jgi:hypothetical protein
MKKMSLSARPRGFRHADESKSKVESAMREVHTNVPRNVIATGKTGAAKEAMIRAIGFNKARARSKKRGKK